MFKIISVTNRTLCAEDLPTRVERLARAGIDGVILREKDLPEPEYEVLARRVIRVCKPLGVPCILHSFPGAAQRLGSQALHLPLPLLNAADPAMLKHFTELGASCHSVEDAIEAQRLGCTYITAGHVFVTDCKKGLAPRGLDFLKDVTASVSIPVYAIGGIHWDNISRVKEAGAAGACIMSGLMQCTSPENEILKLKRQVE